MLMMVALVLISFGEDDVSNDDDVDGDVDVGELGDGRVDHDVNDCDGDDGVNDVDGDHVDN